MKLKWHVGKRRTDDNVLQLPICDDFKCVAWVNKEQLTGYTDDQVAAIMAASPDLLSACRAVLYELEDYSWPSEKTIEDLMHAVRKATKGGK